MKNKFYSALIILYILLFLPAALNSEGLEDLAAKTFNSMADFFTGKYNVTTSIVKFEDFSGLPGMTAQKFYQLLVAKFESGKKVTFIDLSVNFSRNKGKFNLNRTGNLNYLIYIKLIRNRDRLGAGAVIFSKSLDRIVYMKYVDVILPEGEKDIINTRDYGFHSVGFSKVMEFEARDNLLDFKTIKDAAGEERFFFYYPGEIEIYKVQGSRFQKSFSFKLKWGRPYYPVIQPEGKLAYFYRQNTLYVTVGSNFSVKSKIFEFKDSRWQEIDAVNFVPFKLIRINNTDYLAGASYREGKNLFEGKIMLAPFRSGRLRTEEIYEKRLPPFYSLAFAADEYRIESIHVVDSKYFYRSFAADFEEMTLEGERRGSALCALGDKWLVVSDYTELTDNLYFYKIVTGSRQLVYESEIDGEVVFISEGAWKRKAGFWVYIKLAAGRGNSTNEYRLQFWSENDG